MIKKTTFKGKALVLFHKFTRFTKHQKIFVLYLLWLIFFLLFFPIIKVSPVEGSSHGIWLLSGYFFKTMVVTFISLLVLTGWNMSFRFKNIVINYFGFKENDALVNFVLLFIISTSFVSIWDSISVIKNATSTVQVTWLYYFIQLLLLAWLILTLVSVIKKAKNQGKKTKIINVVDEEVFKGVWNKKSIKGLFDKSKEDDEEELLIPHHTEEVEETVEKKETHQHNHSHNHNHNN